MQARAPVSVEMRAEVVRADGSRVDLGEFGSRRFWFRAARWNLSQRHWLALVRNVTDFPRYMLGKG